MNFYYSLFYINSLLLGILIVLKTYFFFAKTRFHAPLEWLYFSKYTIYTSRGEKVIKARRTQNVLSIIILFLIITDLLALLMMKIA